MWADTAYRSKANEGFLCIAGEVSHIHVKKPKDWPVSDRNVRANARKSAVRAKVEHRFAVLKVPMRHHRHQTRRGRHHAGGYSLQHETMGLVQRAICARMTLYPPERAPSAGRDTRENHN